MPTAPSPIWIPQLQQDVTTTNGQTIYGDVYFLSEYNHRYNVYSLRYSTTFTLQPGTFTFPISGAGFRDTDVSSALTSRRSTLIGVIPLINLGTNNSKTPITFSFPTNNSAVSVISLEKDYYVIPQASGDPTNAVGIYKHPGAADIRLPYKNVLIINGVFDASGGTIFGQSSTMIRMEIKQAEYQATNVGDDTESFSEKKIMLPLTILRTDTNIALVLPFTGRHPTTGVVSSKSNSVPNTSGIITREYLDGSIDLHLSDFATTTRCAVTDGTPDYGNVIYYLSLTDTRTFTYQNDYITIVGTKIVFRRSTTQPDGNDVTIPIKFLQEETPIYNRSVQRIGDMLGYSTTIQVKIIKSTPTFVGQIPEANTGNLSTIYKLPDMNKMTTEGSFALVPPGSNNTDVDATFIYSSSSEDILKIRVSDTGSYTAMIYGSGTVTVTITQPATINFNQKIATFNVNIFQITPAIINCNVNVFYTNPYNRQFWTRFVPTCRSSNLFDSVTGEKLTATQVDEVYDMRRKAEILKYNKNVGGFTKSQKFAKASRGELMRKIGNESNYLTGGPAGQFSLVCPTTTANSRLLCGLTSACGVPGKERLLCYDPSINLYNYKRTYEYKAGLQLTANIPTTALTEPTNLRISEYDNVNNRITLVWDAPDSNGGFPITGYVITYSTDNKTWAPYKSTLPNGPTDASGASYNKISGELNGNTIVFERIPNSIEIRANTIYYISVFSGNVRGLSSVPATITVKTSSVPSIITGFGFTNTDERQNLMVDLKWTDPVNTGTDNGAYNGPPIRQYNLYYRKVPDTTWSKQTLDISNIITSGQSRRYLLRNLLNENKYEIKVEPINSVGVGPESAIVTARTLMKPYPPSNVVLTSKYGLLPPYITDISRNYINITWSKPDTGGSPIKYYNITIRSGITNINTTLTYTVPLTSTLTTYNTDIGRLDNNYITDGSYNVVVAAYNGYLTSLDSTRAFVTVYPLTTKPMILNIEGTYNSAGISFANLTFTINSIWNSNIVISRIKVNGLNSSYDPPADINNQQITGTGEYTVRVPAVSAGREIIIVGTTYYVTISFVFATNGVVVDEVSSEIYTYTPEIKYLTI